MKDEPSQAEPAHSCLTGTMSTSVGDALQSFASTPISSGPLLVLTPLAVMHCWVHATPARWASAQHWGDAPLDGSCAEVHEIKKSQITSDADGVYC